MLGIVYWITGLAGAGKTSIGKKLYEKLREKKSNVVFLDGDNLRAILKISCNYSISERLKLAMVYARLCKMLSDQGMDVVCCTISMFNECRDWNKKNIKNYKEVYIKVPFEVLKKRNQKNLYKDKKNVVGLDLEFEEPSSSHLILRNDGKNSLEFLFDILCSKFNIRNNINV
ncbi:MAG: putative adenylyl-sulfate kinase [Candidatus Anoxychlamydiales bacterium]|nr:putative adenylyl-sulfate kinase [Candidatus Anoxychlamydiales bacterium]